MEDIIAPTKIILEGNIGAGKSTLLQYASQYFTGLVTFEEPVKTWQDIGIFEKYYMDQKRWGYTFQITALTTRLMLALEANQTRSSGKDILVERSGIADRCVFMNVMSKYRQLEQVELTTYDLYYEVLMDRFNVYKDAKFIYLRTDPRICRARILKRDRKTEKEGIPMDYLVDLHNAHETLLLDYIDDKPLLIIDGNENYVDDLSKRKEMIGEIAKFADLSLSKEYSELI